MAKRDWILVVANLPTIIKASHCTNPTMVSCCHRVLYRLSLEQYCPWIQHFHAPAYYLPKWWPYRQYVHGLVIT
jgi:hypothetical protein